MEDEVNKTDQEGIEILKYIFKDAEILLFNKIAPNGWKDSEFVHFLHPTPEQQLEQHKIISDNIRQLTKKDPKEDYKDISEFQQDDLESIKEYEEFLYILGLAIYDIFSNNHEVLASDNKVYDFGSMRGSGHFIADFFNDNVDSLSQQYDYMDFYMGTVWVNSRADMLPFYEYVFQKLKELNCNWKYFFPKLFLMKFGDTFDSSTNQGPADYKPEENLLKELKLKEDDKKVNEFQKKLDEIHSEEYENAKYKPLDKIVEAYRNVYGILPEGHPQKEFE